MLGDDRKTYGARQSHGFGKPHLRVAIRAVIALALLAFDVQNDRAARGRVRFAR